MAKWSSKKWFSPQVRGWSLKKYPFISINPVFPAGAGVIPATLAAVGFPESFPRRCGGDPSSVYIPDDEMMFSPQVRGWSLSIFISRYCFHVFPAGAGVIRRPTRFTSSTVQFPRITGVLLAYGIPKNQWDYFLANGAFIPSYTWMVSLTLSRHWYQNQVFRNAGINYIPGQRISMTLFSSHWEGVPCVMVKELSRLGFPADAGVFLVSW